jgi:hypothetical protein
MVSASYLTFRRANLSLMGCTSAEPISVSVLGKVQRVKLYLQTVEIPSHLQSQHVNFILQRSLGYSLVQVRAFGEAHSR